MAGRRPIEHVGNGPWGCGAFYGVGAILVPFPALSGLNLDPSGDALTAGDGNGLAQQFWKLMAAELPVDGNCDAEGCVPTLPMSPITGITGVDRLLWNAMMITGMIDHR